MFAREVSAEVAMAGGIVNVQVAWTCFAPPWDANVDFPTNTKGRYVRTLTLVRGASGPASGAQPMHTDRSGGTVGTLGRPAACYTRVLAPAGWRAESGTRGASGASAGRGLAVGPQSSRLLLRPQDEALRRVSAHLRPQGWVRLVCARPVHFLQNKSGPEGGVLGRPLACTEVRDG